MKRKSPSITSKLWSVSAILAILILWQLSVSLGLVEGFMLPSPVQVAGAFIKEFPALMENARITLAEAGMGLVLGIATGFGAAVLMDRFDKAFKAFYPIIVLTQTVPAVAIAPLLVLWFGYEMTPKVILIVITTFFSHNGGTAHRIQGSGSGCCEPAKGHGSGPVPDILLYQAAGCHGPVLFQSQDISLLCSGGSRDF